MSTRRILVAIDGSNPSFKASNYAIDLAKRYNTELIVLFILSPVPYSQFVYDNIGSTKEIETIEKEKAQQGAQKEVDKVKQKAREKKVSVKTELLVKYTVSHERDCKVRTGDECRYDCYWEQRLDWV